MASAEVALLPAAVEDLRAAVDWYSAQAPHLGPRFKSAVERTAGQIAEFPKLGARVDEEIRRALVPRFPYSVYYWLPTDSTAEILAIVHQSRHPDTWRRSGSKV